MINKILYANSGSGHTQDMLKVLLDLPAIQKASLTLLHVVPPQVSSEATTEKWAAGGEFLQKELKHLNLDISKVSIILRQGEPKDTVCQVAEEINADLLIMGSRGIKGLEAILGNSVSQYVFQLTNRPMLLVKDDIYVKKIKRVMVALDKSSAAAYCLDLALELLRDYPEAQLYLARVNPDLKPELLPLSKTEIENNPVLAPAIAKARRLGINPKAIVTGGKPGEKICELAAENNIDLLMIGSPDRRPSIAKTLPDVDRLLGTSLSDYIRVNATCPVLLARR
ncbi:universal stress protein [Gloeocapsa sp. PCC 73106]|uniref:universal stress protein n=1 Tax=Gloeocapsa sp. PCC 73106 TaxID=102232 RepID=UPI0002ACC7A1|nr:universal stress protein [Gloeocapsa sp. PCC 73106]ELR98251.1 universal stress protein UspA-like protein [Gloeocapsa sp. PCC 73106]